MGRADELIRQLNEKRARLIHPDWNVKAIEKQHSKGKLTARERVQKLLDPNSFVELDLWAGPKRTGYEIDNREIPGDAVITGYGSIAGRAVCIYAQDFTLAGGTLGTTHARKMIKVCKKALKWKIPLIGLIDSGGVRVQDHVTAGPFDSYVSMFYLHTMSSGVIPQIAVMMGPCAAGAAYAPILHDFIFMVKDTSYMYVAGPALTKAVSGVEITDQELGGAKVHATASGCCDVLASNDEDALEQVREMLSYLPLNNDEKPPYVTPKDDSNGKAEELIRIIPEKSGTTFDMHEIISRIVDDGKLFEIKRDFAKNMIVGFARLGGNSVGMVANNTKHKAGSLDIDAADKEARFVRFCDAFNIPLIFLVDTPAYLPGKDQEHRGIIRHGAKVLYAVSEATVPKLTVYVRKAYGGAVSAMCPEPLGSDLLIAWPTAEMALMGIEGAVSILYGKEISDSDDPDEMRKKRTNDYMAQFGEQPYHPAQYMRIEEIIDPRDTRSILINALHMMQHKSEEIPRKKHGNIPL